MSVFPPCRDNVFQTPASASVSLMNTPFITPKFDPRWDSIFSRRLNMISNVFVMMIAIIVIRYYITHTNVTFRTISWSWNSSPTISWLPVRYTSVYIIHMYPMCIAQSAARGTVEIRMTIECAQLKCNLDLISVLHCHVRAHSSWLHNRLA